MNYNCIFLGILFIIAGFIFATGNGHIHLYAWKNMTQFEKDKIKIKPLCRNIGLVIALNGFIFLIKGFLPMFNQSSFIATMIGWSLFAIFDVWYISKSKRYLN